MAPKRKREEWVSKADFSNCYLLREFNKKKLILQYREESQRGLNLEWSVEAMFLDKLHKKTQLTGIMDLIPMLCMMEWAKLKTLILRWVVLWTTLAKVKKATNQELRQVAQVHLKPKE